MERYPEAQVILTVRDPEGWYNSVHDTIYQIIPEIKKISPDFKEFLKLVWQKICQSRFSDKDFAIKAFNEHVEQVKNLVPSHRLLVYQVKDGWEPLCQFLKTPIPNKPFPHLNDRASFSENLSLLRNNAA
jgi:hypothetical protein